MLLPHSPILVFVFMALFAIPAVVGAVQSVGAKKAALLVIGLAIFATLFEYLAVKTGFPYGYFWYADVILPKLADTVPVFVSLGWIPLFIGASALANRAGVPKGVPFMLTVALVMLAADLVIDPGAVAEGLWAFRNGGEYLGVPISNFVGWLFMGSVAGLIFENKIRSEKAVAGYLAIVAFWMLIAIAHGMILPSIFGLLIFAVVSWFDLKKHGWQSGN